MSIHDVIRRVLTHDLEHVVITGGEPMLFSELIPLCESLNDHGCHITMETAGTSVPTASLRSDVDQSQAVQLDATR